ncbi:MAG TPA: MOSC domain-containing protein [Bryobacteraceae bacterium]|nr:MOSC domain-containing protein [Bryobacteraceae bacterium]
MSPASVLQINISPGGVPKRPIPKGLVTPLGITGDGHNNPQVHGGPRKAVLLVTSEGIDELKEQGFPLYYGALGENLTTRGLDRRTVRVGQRYRIGDVLLEITKLRTPCENLNVYGPGIHKAVYDQEAKDGNPASPVWGLGGFYASVVQAGTIRPGDPIHLLDESA